MARQRLRDDEPIRWGPQGTMPAWDPDRTDITSLLEDATFDSFGVIPWGSNYTFLVNLSHPEEGCGHAVYKPLRGETPLYDFPEGTLYRRERAAYLLSKALGWNLVPPTVVRDGPYGVGMVQLFVDADTNAHYFTFGAEIPDMARRICLFDCIVNNTDRKAGHVLRGVDGRVWAIDHGLTFSVQPKLRTVIWDFAGEPFPEALVEDMTATLASFKKGDGVMEELRALLNGRECEALVKRIERLIARSHYPHPTSYHSMPWPSV